MDREQALKNIIEYFEQNEDIFNDCIEDLDSYNGYLGDDRIYSMDELSELYSGTDPIDLLNRAYFGYDAETWNTDSSGHKEYGPFNPNREYFTFNGYGNFVSMDHKDYSDRLDKWTVEAMAEERGNLWYLNKANAAAVCYEELQGLFDELENADQDEQEAC